MPNFFLKEPFGRTFSYMVFFYIAAFLFFGPVLKNTQALDIAKLRTLNRLMPPLNDLINSYVNGKSLEETQIDKYLFYYMKVSDYLPKNADGFYMKGYCFVRKGLLEQAVKAYQQSSALNPHFFWVYYNLGLVYLKLNQWDSAIESFQKALNTKPEVTIKVMLTSKVFQQLLAQVDQPGKILPSNLKIAYKDCYQLMLLANTLKRGSSKEIPLQVYNHLEGKIF